MEDVGSAEELRDERDTHESDGGDDELSEKSVRVGSDGDGVDGCKRESPVCQRVNRPRVVE